MKRHPALADLSRDHHQVLFRAMKLKRATDDDAAELRGEALKLWREREAHHFRVEEEVLLPAFAAVGDPASEAVVTVLVDHIWIRERMERLAADTLDVDGLRELGERLERHVRHEERVLFPLIEETLDDRTLDALGRRLADAEAA